MITQANSANSPIDHKIGQIRSVQSMVTARKKTMNQRSKQNTTFGFQPQTQRTSGISNPEKNDTETTKGIHLTEVTDNSPLTSSNLIPVSNVPLKKPTKTFRTNPDSKIEPNTSESLHPKIILFMKLIIKFESEKCNIANFAI